jgi:hypothetical protein
MTVSENCGWAETDAVVMDSAVRTAARRMLVIESLSEIWCGNADSTGEIGGIPDPVKRPATILRGPVPVIRSHLPLPAPGVHSAMRRTLPVALLAMGFAAGCAAPGPTHSRPPGFTLAATIHAPAEQAARSPRALTPARFVVESDALLRIAIGRALDAPSAAFPPQVRRLSASQMDDLWSLAKDAQLFDPDHPGRHPPPVPSPIDLQSPVVVFEVTRHYAPIIVVVELDQSTAEAIAAARLLDRLAELAWIPE